MIAFIAFAFAASTPPVPHVTTDPLLPQKYRTVPLGKYPCSVEIDVAADGKVTDVRPVACDEDAFWPVATAIVQWRFDPATTDGTPVAATLPYTTVFEVTTLVPRKHIVGFVGLAASVGGAGWGGVEGRIHLGEQISFTAGVDMDQDRLENSYASAWVPTVRADATFSTRRRSHEQRGTYGITVGGFGDGYGAVGGYGAFRGEAMIGVPGVSLGLDAGVATMFTDPPTYDDVGFWQRAGVSPFYPWLRASVIWYAPLPRDRFVVVPRAQDPVLYEPEPVPPDIAPDIDGAAFAGTPAIHWSEIEPAEGGTTPTGPGFAAYPPGSYACNVRVVVGEDGLPKNVRVEKCPAAGRDDALETVKHWRWTPTPGRGDVQSVFPAPIFVEREDAVLLAAQSVLLLDGDKAEPLGRRVPTPLVYARDPSPPAWGVTLPTRPCMVDVDLDATGKVLATRWVSGDVEVKPRVDEALATWRFYPVAVDGELRAARVRLSMCEE